MRTVHVKRIVDARERQQRLIYHLSCGHNAFVSTMEVAASGRDPRTFLAMTTWQCDLCPDITRAEQRQQLSPQELARQIHYEED